MSSIDRQQEILDKVYRIIIGSCPEGVYEACCRFSYERFEDGSESVEQEFSYVKGGRRHSAALDRALRAPIFSLVVELHCEMKAHTGGDWRAFTLRIDERGGVGVKFDYS